MADSPFACHASTASQVEGVSLVVENRSDSFLRDCFHNANTTRTPFLRFALEN
jgi:hypothetical protein